MPSPVESSALELGRALAADGRLLEAIPVLTAANRQHPDHELERRLVRTRLDAFAEVDRTRGRRSWPPRVLHDRFRGSTGVPEVTRDSLTTSALRSGIVRHGCLLVRGLVDPEEVGPLVDGITRAFDGYDAHQQGAPISETAPWFVPFEPGAGEAVIGRAWDPLIPRGWARDAGGVMTVDSPPMLFRLIEALEDARIGPLLEDYFGEPPALSVKKSTLRRTEPTSGTWWHQDGAFLGSEVRSVNVWIALSHCGDVAPGLDLIPKRFDRILETGTGDAQFAWSIGSDVIAREGDVARPIFEAGDALFFDERLPHSTAVATEMDRDRFAIETWFFAPSSYPFDQIPLAY